MNRWDLSGQLARGLAGPLARVSGHGARAADIRESLDEPIVAGEDAVEANQLRAYAWLVVMVVLVGIAVVLFAVGKAAGLPVVQTAGGLLLVIGIGAGGAALPHTYRMSLGDRPAACGSGPPARALPKVRDSYVGLAIAVASAAVLGVMFSGWMFP